MSIADKLTQIAENQQEVFRAGYAAGMGTDHSTLLNRDQPDQHPISAITGLKEALDNIPTDTHINDLINTALGVIENGTY